MSLSRTTAPAILVIEDTAMIRQIYEIVLGAAGYAVRCAESTARAVAAVEAGFLPDAIVSDFDLGAGDIGVVAILAVIDRLGRPIPATIITGHAGFFSDRFPVLRKPIRPPQLKEAVAAMLPSPTAGRAPHPFRKCG